MRIEGYTFYGEQGWHLHSYRQKNTQRFHEKSAKSIMTAGYMIAVRDGKEVGSSLSYDPETNKLVSKPYHIYVNQWHNDTEGIDFNY